MTGRQRGLIAIAALAVLLRLPALLWGLPVAGGTVWIHPDEHTVQLHGERFPRSLVDNEEPQYPTGLTVISRTALAGPALLLTAVRPMLSEEPWKVWLTVWGRLVSILMGALAAVAATLAARELGRESGAWVAGLFVASAIWLVDHASFLTGDVPAAGMFAVSLWMLARLLRSGERRDALLTGLAAGAAAAVKYVAGLIALPALLVLLSRRRPRQAALLAVSCAAGFLLLDPSALFHPLDILRRVQLEGGIVANHGLMPWPEYLAYVARTSWWIVGPAVLLVPLGAARMLRDPGRALAVLAVPLLFFVLVKGFYDRHMIFLVPALAVLAAAAVGPRDPRSWRACVHGLLAANVALAGFTVLQRALDVRQTGRLVRELRAALPEPPTPAAIDPVGGFTPVPWPGVGRAPLSGALATMVVKSTSLDAMRAALVESTDPATGEIDPRFRYRFFEGRLPSRQDLALYRDLLSADGGRYRRLVTVEQPGSSLLRWYLEFFPHEHRLYVRRKPS